MDMVFGVLLLLAGFGVGWWLGSIIVDMGER